MLLYSGIMFGTGAVLLVLAAKIAGGQVELIHDYHQKRVTDRAGYGKAFGKAMGVITGALVLSGWIALLGESAGIVCSAVAVLLVGTLVGVICIARVQKKYNGGIFLS
jgi:uncharacterized protein YsxB (DUF464 family)